MCNGQRTDENVTDNNTNPDSNGMWVSPVEPMDSFPHPSKYPTFAEFDAALEEFKAAYPEIDTTVEMLRRIDGLMSSIREKLGITPPISPAQTSPLYPIKSISPQAKSNPGLVAKLFPTAPQPEDFFDSEDYEMAGDDFADTLSSEDRIRFLETLVLENAILRGHIPSPILARDIVDAMMTDDEADEAYLNDGGTPRSHTSHNHTTDPEDIDIHLDVIEVTTRRYVTVATVTNKQTGNVYKGAAIKNPNDTNTSHLEGQRIALRRALATTPFSAAVKKAAWTAFVEQVVTMTPFAEKPKEVAFADILEAASNQSFAGDLDDFMAQAVFGTKPNTIPSVLARLFGVRI